MIFFLNEKILGFFLGFIDSGKIMPQPMNNIGLALKYVLMVTVRPVTRTGVNYSFIFEDWPGSAGSDEKVPPLTTVVVFDSLETERQPGIRSF